LAKYYLLADSNLFLANEFAVVVGPYIHPKETPTGFFLVGGEGVLFFNLLMTAQVLGPFLWVVHLLLLWVFRKRNKGKTLCAWKITGFILLNILLLAILYIMWNQPGLDD